MGFEPTSPGSPGRIAHVKYRSLSIVQLKPFTHYAIIPYWCSVYEPNCRHRILLINTIMIELECLICNKVFYDKPCRASMRKTCSIACSIIHQKNIKGRPKKECPICQVVHDKHGPYCSRQCANSVPRKNSGPAKGYNQQIFEYTKVCFKPCKKCNQIITLSASKPNFHYTRNYCDECRYENKQNYRQSCYFKLSPTKHSELYDFNMIKTYGWYQPHSAKKPNPTGVTWDHLYQIQEGFKNSIPPEIINHPANAELVPYEENFRRRLKSLITVEELYQRIKLWDSGTRILPTFYNR